MRTQPHRIALLLLYAILLLISTQHTLRADEPSYRGRSLSLWLQDLALGRFPDMEKHRAAEEAIRSIGAAAIPVLTDRLRVTSDKLDQVQDFHTVSAFRALGPQARAAIPVLVELLVPAYDAARESPSEPNAQLNERKSTAVALALQAIGQDSVGPLIEALSSANRKIRFGAAMTLEYFPRHEKVVVPALIKTFDDKDCDVRWRAARSLGALHAMPELSVPALAERVRTDPATNVRCYAIFALAKFGNKAKAAIPVLARATTDPDSSIRSYAREALTAIGPAASKDDDPKP
jgi:HEAT repeat protein